MDDTMEDMVDDMIRRDIVRPIGIFLACLIGLSALLLFAAVGTAEAFQRGGGGTGRGSHGYDGHRGGNRTQRSGAYRSPTNRTRPPVRSGYLRGPGRENTPPAARRDRSYVRPDARRHGTELRRGEVFRHGKPGKPNYHRRPSPYPGYRYPGYRYDGPRHFHDRYRFHRRPVWRPGWRYRPGFGPGRFWVRPGIGSMFVTLPLGSAAVIIGGSRYFYYDDVYYRPVPSGYVVVAPPSAAVAQIAAQAVEYRQATVTAKLLNVRSGPGSGYAPFSQVRQGEVLDVLGESGGWLYVELSGGQKGWVDARYVAPIIIAGG